MVKERVVADWKKKKWYSIAAPAIYNNEIIGETSVMESSQLVGKAITVNLMTLTKSMKKQSQNITFKITELKENVGQTKTYRFEMQPSSIKRLVRAGRDRVDESFIVKTKDEQYARVKPLFITRNKQPMGVQTKLRKVGTAVIRKYAEAITFEEFVKDVVDGKVQKTLRDTVMKITPLRNADIRVVELVENFTILKQKKLEKRQAQMAIKETPVEEDEDVEEQEEVKTQDEE